jgi:immunity protein Imm1 of predicted polymorphic toxin system
MAMKKYTEFDTYSGEGWPDLNWLEPYFLAPPGKQWFYDNSDSGGLYAKGVGGTEHLEPYRGRIDLSLDMIGNPQLGLFLMYRRVGGGPRHTFFSKGDVRRLHEWVRNMRGDQMPIGLFIPFDVAWKAVKEFIETDGQLPKSIEWFRNEDLPPGVWPDR